MANKFYRKKNPDTGVEDFYEANTDRYIGPEEFKTGGYTEQKPDPRAEARSVDQPYVDARGGTGYLDSFKKNQNYLTILKDAIQRKMHRNKDIRGAKDYWRTQQRDPMTFTDEKLRLLSPAEQRSLREKRYATAGAHMKGLEEEEAYRGGRLEDIMRETRGLQEGEMAAREKDQISEGRRLENLKKKTDFGYKVKPEDVYDSFVDPDGQRVGFKKGGSLTWRKNNPGAIKYDYGNGNQSKLSKDLEASGIEIKKGSPMQDGGHAIAFPSEDAGWDAAKLLLSGDYGYQDLTLDEAMKRWSNGGNGGNIFSDGAYNNYKLNTITESPGLLDDLIASMRAREEWKEGEYLRPETDVEHETWTFPNVEKIASKAGLSAQEVWDEWTDEEISELNRLQNEDPESQTIVDLKMKNLNPESVKKTGITNLDVLREALTLRFVEGANNKTMKDFGREIGLNLTDENIKALEYIGLKT